MFTGLVEGVGKIKAVRRIREDMTLMVDPEFPMDDLRVGDSISVDGVCLTVTDLTGGTFAADVSDETLARSTLGSARQGDRVNLERALRLADRLGGHLVSGHVDGTGRILMKEPVKRSWRLRIKVDARFARHMIEKGSIAVDGISLTINRTEGPVFEVNVVPLTATETTLLAKGPGSLVNIETDMIAKYVEKLTAHDGQADGEKEASGSRIDLEMLKNYGFGE